MTNIEQVSQVEQVGGANLTPEQAALVEKEEHLLQVLNEKQATEDDVYGVSREAAAIIYDFNQESPAGSELTDDMVAFEQQLVSGEFNTEEEMQEAWAQLNFEARTFPHNKEMKRVEELLKQAALKLGRTVYGEVVAERREKKSESSELDITNETNNIEEPAVVVGQSVEAQEPDESQELVGKDEGESKPTVAEKYPLAVAGLGAASEQEEKDRLMKAYHEREGLAEQVTTAAQSNGEVVVDEQETETEIGTELATASEVNADDTVEAEYEEVTDGKVDFDADVIRLQEDLGMAVGRIEFLNQRLEQIDGQEDQQLVEQAKLFAETQLRVIMEEIGILREAGRWVDMVDTADKSALQEYQHRAEQEWNQAWAQNETTRETGLAKATVEDRLALEEQPPEQLLLASPENQQLLADLLESQAAVEAGDMTMAEFELDKWQKFQEMIKNLPAPLKVGGVLMLFMALSGLLFTKELAMAYLRAPGQILGRGR